jgi:hypothetical protein
LTRPSLVLVHSPVLGPASVQATARALSGLGWICIVPSLSGAGSVDEHVAAAAAGVADGSVLIAHSGAGPLVPAIAAATQGRVAGAVFLDARLPNVEGSTPMAEPEMLQFLESIAVDGVVPRWSQWWGDEAVAVPTPQSATAEGMQTEMRRLPLAFFRSEVPVPAGWPDTPCAYLQMSSAYAAAATEARGRGWTVDRVDGSHLDVATRPTETAAALDRLLEQLP